MKTARMELGARGEEEACKYLEERGHTVLARNWRHSHLEVDIISLDRSGVHFVEVKTRMAPVSAEPEENVTYAKQRKITAAANAFLHGKRMTGFGDVEVFFDVVSVIFAGEKVEITYFPQAYLPMYF